MPPQQPTPGASATPTFEEMVTALAKREGVDPRIALSFAEIESSLNPNVSDSSAGAIGPFQLMPETAKRHNVNPRVLHENILGGLRELKQLRAAYGDDLDLLARRYNASPQAPRELTDPYVAKFREALQRRIAGASPSTAPATVPAKTATAPPAPPAWAIDPRVRAEGPPPPAWAVDPRITEETKNTPRPPSGLRAFGGELQSLDPRPLLRMGGEATQAVLSDPLAAFAKVPEVALAIGRGMLQSTGAQGQKMVDAYNRGDYVRAALEAKNWLLSPLGIGQRLSAAEEYARQGDTPRMLGATTDVAAMTAVPEALRRAPSVRVAPRVFRSRLPPEQQAAVDFGLRERIPVDVGTATGNRAVQRFQGAMESTLPGGAVRAGVERTRGQRLATLGDELAGRVHPATVTPEAAGTGLRQTLEQAIADRHAAANAEYTTLRQIEAQPQHAQTLQVGTRTITSPVLGPNGQPITQTVPVMQTIQLPVDLRVAKRRLRPVYDRLARQLPITQQQASPGLRALQNLLDGPDFAPATQVDTDLSVIKSLARGADLPELRDVSQGVAARGVQALSDAVDRAIARAGPQAQTALAQGRRATARKYAIAEVLDQLQNEPVGAFRQATRGGDTQINFLRALEREAPREMPRVARAVLDDLLETATERGGYERAAAVANRWERLGTETRNILFGPQHAADLDHFFLLSRMLAEHPNPSKSALSIASALSGGWMMSHPGTGIPANAIAGSLAVLLNSRTGVRLLTRGLVTPGATAAARLWGTEVANLLGRQAEQTVGEPPPPPPEETR